MKKRSSLHPDCKLPPSTNIFDGLLPSDVVDDMSSEVPDQFFNGINPFFDPLNTTSMFVGTCVGHTDQTPAPSLTQKKFKTSDHQRAVEKQKRDEVNAKLRDMQTLCNIPSRTSQVNSLRQATEEVKKLQEERIEIFIGISKEIQHALAHLYTLDQNLYDQIIMANQHTIQLATDISIHEKRYPFSEKIPAHLEVECPALNSLFTLARHIHQSEFNTLLRLSHPQSF